MEREPICFDTKTKHRKNGGTSQINYTFNTIGVNISVATL